MGKLFLGIFFNNYQLIEDNLYIIFIELLKITPCAIEHNWGNNDCTNHLILV